jgi:hypothetical protein
LPLGAKQGHSGLGSRLVAVDFSKLDACLSAALEAIEKLNTHLEMLSGNESRDAVGQQRVPGREQVQPKDIAILRDKYQAVSTYAQSISKLTEWLRGQTKLAVEIQTQPDAEQFVRHMKQALLQGLEPVPSPEVIESDLKSVAHELGAPYTRALEAYNRLFSQALKSIDHLSLDFEHESLIGSVIAAIAAVDGLKQLAAISARKLRNQLVQQIDSIQSRNDLTAYRPMKEFLTDPFNTPQSIHAVLNKYPWIRTHRPSPQRRLIHAGDWMKMLSERSEQAFKAMGTESEVTEAMADELRNRRDKIREQKMKRKPRG